MAEKYFASRPANLPMTTTSKGENMKRAQVHDPTESVKKYMDK